MAIYYITLAWPYNWLSDTPLSFNGVKVHYYLSFQYQRPHVYPFSISVVLLDNIIYNGLDRPCFLLWSCTFYIATR